MNSLRICSDTIILNLGLALLEKFFVKSADALPPIIKAQAFGCLLKSQSNSVHTCTDQNESRCPS